MIEFSLALSLENHKLSRQLPSLMKESFHLPWTLTFGQHILAAHRFRSSDKRENTEEDRDEKYVNLASKNCPYNNLTVLKPNSSQHFMSSSETEKEEANLYSIPIDPSWLAQIKEGEESARICWCGVSWSPALGPIGRWFYQYKLSFRVPDQRQWYTWNYFLKPCEASVSYQGYF